MIRVIPVLLLRGKGLVKTINFTNPTYIGDPINAVRIFNEKEVDELVICDIEVGKTQNPPNFDYIKSIVSESFMPVGYGGGIRNLDHIKQLIDLGVEKIVLNTMSTDNNLIRQAANIFGSQSVVVSIDCKKNFFGNYKVYTKGGATQQTISPSELAIQAVNAGAGEIFIQSIDREGTMKGYDIQLTQMIASAVRVPVVALGGAGSLQDISEVIEKGGASSAAAGSIFVYKGKHKAVLINYPGYEVIRSLVKNNI